MENQGLPPLVQLPVQIGQNGKSGFHLPQGCPRIGLARLIEPIQLAKVENQGLLSLVQLPVQIGPNRSNRLVASPKIVRQIYPNHQMSQILSLQMPSLRYV